MYGLTLPMKTVGIIGGLGPETTARFYLELIALCQKKDDRHRPPILIWNVPISYQAEWEEIINGKFSNEMPELLIAAAKQLERNGADFVVLPCNSSHVFINAIKDAIHIPILNMLDVTIQHLKNNHISQVGILSTLITRKSELYSSVLKANNISFEMPTNAEQENLNNLILKLTLADYGDKEKAILQDVMKQLRHRGIKHIVLACAALEVLISQKDSDFLHDTMKIYAQATARVILNEGK